MNDGKPNLQLSSLNNHINRYRGCHITLNSLRWRYFDTNQQHFICSPYRNLRRKENLLDSCVPHFVQNGHLWCVHCEQIGWINIQSRSQHSENRNREGVQLSHRSEIGVRCKEGGRSIWPKG